MRAALVVVGGWLSLMGVVAADQVCVEKATGKLLEYQSAAQAGTCEQNWVIHNPQYGYTAGQVEERTVTAAEARQLMDAANQPARDLQVEKRKKHNAVMAKLCTGAGLVGQEAQDCKDELK